MTELRHSEEGGMVSGCDADEFPPRSIGEIRRVLHRTRAHIAPPALRSLAYAPFLIVPEWLQPDPLSITIGLVGWAVLEYALWRRRRQKR